MRVDATSYADAVSRVTAWAARGDSRYVCIATVNNAMVSRGSREFRRAMNAADLVTPDGMPLVWALKLLGVPTATRVYGPDLTWHVLAAAARRGIPVAFYGSTTEVVRKLRNAVAARYPDSRIAFTHSPPFGEASPAEDAQVVDAINASGAGILFVGLSTPKQDRWMAAHRGRVQAVMLGVGAAFDFLAGAKPQAPRWMMRVGLEWLFRLGTEPRRLAGRYIRQNPRFLLAFGRQLIGHWRHRQRLNESIVLER